MKVLRGSGGGGAIAAWVCAWIVGLAFPVIAEEPGEVAGLILTWQRDPSSTMTIDWHEASPLEKPVLLHRRKGGDAWKTSTPVASGFPHAPGRMVYRVELTGLESDADYEFRPAGRELPYHFRTMPKRLTRTLRVVVGGDTAPAGIFEKINAVAASLKPDFILWGGDYSYSDGKAGEIKKEILWHENIRDHLIGADRRVIPVIAAIGNHEVNSVVAPYYEANFAFPAEETYGVLDFGDYLSVWVLDTNHRARVAGKQTEWFAESLAARAKDPQRILIPVYHVPAYPSVRKDEGTSLEIRKHWVPLFENAGISAAFEHHDHAYKRTHPLLGGKVQDAPEKGVTYLGDGAWGAGIRKVRPPADVPHIAKSQSVNHVFFFEVGPEGPLRFQAIDPKGEVFDRFELPRRR
jgi:acid phosphatase type 7